MTVYVLRLAGTRLPIGVFSTRSLAERYAARVDSGRPMILIYTIDLLTVRTEETER